MSDAATTALQALDAYPVALPVTLQHNLQQLREMRMKLFGLAMLPSVALLWLLGQLIDSFWLVASATDLLLSRALWYAVAALVIGYLVYALMVLPRAMAADPPLDIILTREAITLVPYSFFRRQLEKRRALPLQRTDCVIVQQARPDASVASILLGCAALAQPLQLGSNRTAIALRRADNLARTLELTRRNDVLEAA